MIETQLMQAREANDLTQTADTPSLEDPNFTLFKEFNPSFTNSNILIHSLPRDSNNARLIINSHLVQNLPTQMDMSDHSHAETNSQRSQRLTSQKRLYKVIYPTQTSPDFLTSNKYQDTQQTIMWGFGIVVFAMILFVVLAFWMFGAKMVPKTGHPIIDFMQEDYYYCAMLPLLYPIFFIFIYKNWVGLKAFRHN